MITKEYRMAVTELNQILRYTSELEVNKIPLGLRLFFKEIADDSYVPDINPEVSLFNQKLLNETQELLAMIYCYYWSTEEELEEMPEYIKENAKHIGKEIFENVPTFNGESPREQTSLAVNGLVKVSKEPWYKKIFGWFRRK